MLSSTGVWVPGIPPRLPKEVRAMDCIGWRSTAKLPLSKVCVFARPSVYMKICTLPHLLTLSDCLLGVASLKGIETSFLFVSLTQILLFIYIFF
jgi:hypothetical protein